MENKKQAKNLLDAWVKLSGLLKNTRITKGLMYNEATVMLILYKKYTEDGEGIVSVRDIVFQTNMLKSLVTRTVTDLEKKGLLERCEADDSPDKRIRYVRCVKEKLDIFLEVHESSLALSEKILNVIGKEDAQAFVRIVKKIEKAAICRS